MPTVTVQLTEQLLELATARAAALGTSIDELYVEAIDRYLEVTKHASAGSLRSRHFPPRSSPKVTSSLPAEAAMEKMHDLPSGAWRPKRQA